MTMASTAMTRSMLPLLLMMMAPTLATQWPRVSQSSTLPDNVWNNIDGNRRSAKVRILQYGKMSGQGHPFESYSTQRLALQSQDETHLPPFSWRERDPDSDSESSSYTNGVYFEDDRYPASVPTPPPTIVSTTEPTPRPSRAPTPQRISGAPTPRPTLAPFIINYNAALYKPIRIQMDDRQLQMKKQSRPKKYAKLVDYITNYASPAAEKFWSDHLSTIPVEGYLVVTKEDCPAVFGSDRSRYHEFDDTDLVLYLFLDEGPCLEDSPPIAFSNDCAMDQFDRPIAGTLLICSEHFMQVSAYSEIGRSQQQKLDEVLQHELAHVLGMSGATMPYWRDALNGGKPYTHRPLVETDVVCINGETESIVMPSQSTLVEGTTKSGVRYFEVVTPTLRNVIANQFDCENATGARLDQNEYYNCLGSHLSTRMFGTETMVSRNMPWEQKISAVTMALFEDTGWYKANYKSSSGVLHPTSYGYGAGCSFLTDTCIVDDEVPSFGLSTFCNVKTEDSAIKCDVSHKRAAKCDLVDYSVYDDDPLYPFAITPNPPGAEYQHYSNSGLGSFLRYDADYCPTYSAPPYFKYDGGSSADSSEGTPTGPLYMDCSVGSTAPTDAFTFESFGSDQSTCFNTIGDIERPLCLSIQCIQSDGEVTVAVGMDYGDNFICEEDGQVIELPSLNIKIECPRQEVLCPEMFCPANCAGRGRCRHGVINGCECFDPEDTSPLCENSPIQPYSPTPAPSTKEPHALGVSPNPTSSVSSGDIRDDVPNETPDGIIEDTPQDVPDDIYQPTKFPSYQPTGAPIKPVPVMSHIPAGSLLIENLDSGSPADAHTFPQSHGPTEIPLPPSPQPSTTPEEGTEMAVDAPSVGEGDLAVLTPSRASSTQSNWLVLLVSLSLIRWLILG